MGKRVNSQLNNKGVTLVELIVSFALLSLFMVAATKVISDTISLYYQAKGIQEGMQVSSVISSKISTEIEGGIESAGISATNPEASVVIASDKKSIELTDSKGSHVRICTTPEQYMLIYYIVLDEDGNINTTESSNWTFDEKAYMGYQITDMQFIKLSEVPSGDKDAGRYDGNVIRLDLTLHSGKYGDYSTSTYIECYNFKNKGDKIVQE